MFSGSELARRREALAGVYAAMARRTRESARNFVPPLPLALEESGRIAFRRASSMAIQSLLHPDAEDALLALRRTFSERFPDVAARTFWQPPGTFHVNVAILSRLAAVPLAEDERARILRHASRVLDWLETQPAYDIALRHVLLAADGTLLAVGYPASLTPWTIREEFARAGFADQQPIFHVTVGRILQVLPEETWRAAVAFIDARQDADVGVLRIGHAMLVDEHEGFLHTPACYDVLRRFTWR